MIISANISHYKSISEAQLKFRAANIIVGPNGSGKSNIIDALYFLRDCAVDDIDTAVTKRHGIDSLRQWSRTRPYNIILEVNLKNEFGTGSYKVIISSSKGHYKIIEEHGSWYGPSPRERFRRPQGSSGYSNFSRNENGDISIYTTFEDLRADRVQRVDADDLFLTLLAGRFSVGALAIFRPIAEELSSFSKYNIYPNTLRNPQLVSREAALAEDGANLSSVLKRINGNKRFTGLKDDILSSLRIIMPSIIDFQVKSAAGYYVPVLRVREPNNDVHDFNLSQISDGTLRTLGLLAAFYQPAAPKIIGVEEPEQMIHPGALTVIYEAINSFARTEGRDRQAFITTHSPTLLDLFEPEDIIWARFRHGVTECGPVRKRQLEVIKDQLFSAGELLIAEGIF